MQNIYMYDDIITDYSIDLNIPHNDKCICLKIKKGLIHPCGHIFTLDNKLSKTKHYTCNKWYNKTNSIYTFSNIFIEKKIVSLIQIWNNYFQHITFDTLPKIVMLKKLLNNDKDIFILVMNDIQKNLLVDFGNICEDKIIIRPESNVVYKTNIAYYIAFINSENKSTKMGCSGYNLLSNYLSNNTNNNIICYISRRGLNKRFMDSNQENVLIKKLQTICIKYNKILKIYINLKNPDQIKEVLQKTCVLISIHGGALGNMIWCNKNTHIIEIIPYNCLQERPCFYYLACSLGINYTYIEPEQFDFNKNQPVLINNKKILDCIKKILNK